jgi:CHAT domain-containing protein/tetratricopeptide (TPR) repeat protein
MQFLPYVSRATTPEIRTQIVGTLAKRLLEVGDALDCGPPPQKIGKFRSIGLFLRAQHYGFIVSSLLGLSREWRVGLSEAQLLQVIHFGELALSYHVAGAEKTLGKGWTAGARSLICRRKVELLSSYHIILATVYAELDVGDTSRNLEIAEAHYESAAKILEQAGGERFSLGAARIWTNWGTTLLYYPTEHRRVFAQRAVEVLSRAKDLVVPFAASAEPPPEAMRDSEAWRRLSFAARTRWTVPYVARLTASTWRMRRKGVIDPLMSGMLLPSFVTEVYWRLGCAYHRLGNLNQAIEHFDRALRNCLDDVDTRVAILVDKASAYLELHNGERRKNLDLATECINKSLAQVPKLRSERIYALTLLADARTCLEFDAIGALRKEKREEVFALVSERLRKVAKIGRTIAMPQIVEEALLLLGKVYELRGDTAHAYHALALASRLADRLDRRARTPRLRHYLVGSRASLYERLIRVALEYRIQCQKLASEKKEKTRGVSLVAALCFAEKGRTRFLRTELASLDLVPRGGTEADLKGFFALRRLWHDAELKLLEQESALATDPETLSELRESRNGIEALYFTELEKVRRKYDDPAYDPDQPIIPVRFDEIRSVVNTLARERQEETALIEFHLTDKALEAFVLLPNQLSCERIAISRDHLKAIGDRWEEGYAALRMPQHWEAGYLHQVLDRLTPIAKMPTQAIEAWEQETGRRIKRLIIVPHGVLHLMPLHAIELTKGGKWGERFSIQYTPSATALFQLLHRKKHSLRRSPPRQNNEVVCVSFSPPSQENDEQPLLFHVEEARAVAEATDGTLLTGPEATPRRVKQAMRDATYIHFACHGVVDRKRLLDAGLRLAPDADDRNGQPKEARDERHTASRTMPLRDGVLTLGEIFKDVLLPRAPLVVLSACKTGLTNVREWHEEFIGLPAAFIYAGASTVVSTLWPIPDVATWLLMRSFAQGIAAGIDPVLSMRQAQEELRNISLESVLERIAHAAEREDNADRREGMIRVGEYLRRQSDPHPFAGPYWWAGFTVIGLGDRLFESNRDGKAFS